MTADQLDDPRFMSPDVVAGTAVLEFYILNLVCTKFSNVFQYKISVSTAWYSAVQDAYGTCSTAVHYRSGLLFDHRGSFF